jgi:hypothetical protein
LKQALNDNGEMFHIYRVARELKMTVSRLCAEMTPAELLGWAAFFSIEADDHRESMEKMRRR